VSYVTPIGLHDLKGRCCVHLPPPSLRALPHILVTSYGYCYDACHGTHLSSGTMHSHIQPQPGLEGPHQRTPLLPVRASVYFVLIYALIQLFNSLYVALCSWYCCNFCAKRYLQQVEALTHVAICPSRISGTPNVLREGFDARYPLLVVWSLGMGLPSLKPDRSGNAEMIVRTDPVQVWDCAKGSRQITFRQRVAGPGALE